MPALFKVRYHCPWYLLLSLRTLHFYMVFFCKLIPLFALLFSSSDCKMSTLRVNFLTVSLPRPSLMVLFLYFCLAVSSTMRSPLLDYVVRDRECIQSQFVKFSSGFAVNQAMSTSAIHNSLIPLKKTVRTLYFWYSFAQLE